ncbi:hypothetical protein GCM10017567_19730 [Amycolatopsis bullii]|uniref:Uncharacterized protein n=1 Tax=Amycolatopsis bullii TaxID=941987 RepID=A0ABQ3K9P9_9PSEU|nr:hypothetical protein GCM10017567_19730 [Amycolatopsis bullii]
MTPEGLIGQQLTVERPAGTNRCGDPLAATGHSSMAPGGSSETTHGHGDSGRPHAAPHPSQRVGGTVRVEVACYGSDRAAA